MIRLLLAVFLLSGPVCAQNHNNLGGVVDVAVQADGETTTVSLMLPDAVPHRVYTQDNPRHLVIDLLEGGWTIQETVRDGSIPIGAATAAMVPIGGTRIVFDLDGPYALASAGMTVTDLVKLDIVLIPTDAATFADNATARSDLNTTLLPVAPADDFFTVVIDPGHGGVDPGAVQGGVKEADVMLALATELHAVLAQTDKIQPVLTRQTDAFVSLQGRMSRARAVGADVFVSLHADALERDEAQGASVYTLSEKGADRAADQMATRHERNDLVTGLDFTGQSDAVATTLMDLARREMTPKSNALADQIIAGMQAAGTPLNARARRQGQFIVLTAADFASVLIEVGFLSNPADRARLSTRQGRGPIVSGIAAGIISWTRAETELRQ